MGDAGRVCGQLLVGGEREGCGVVEIPVFFWGGEGQVRSGESRGDEEWGALFQVTSLGGFEAAYRLVGEAALPLQ